MRTLRTRAILLILPLLPACYTHVPVEREQAPRNGNVRTHISAAAVERLGPMFGRSGQAALDGRLLRWSRDTLALQVSERIMTAAGTSRPLTQTVYLADDEVITVEAKRLDRMRTVGLAGLIAGATAAVVIQALSGTTGGNPPAPRPPGPSELRIPLPSLQSIVP